MATIHIKREHDLTREQAREKLEEVAQAVDAFREAMGLSDPGSGGTPSGFVDTHTVALMWDALEEAGTVREVRDAIRDATRIRR